MVRHKLHLDFNGTPCISSVFQWYAITYIWISVVRSFVWPDRSDLWKNKEQRQLSDWISMVRHKLQLDFNGTS